MGRVVGMVSIACLVWVLTGFSEVALADALNEPVVMTQDGCFVGAEAPGTGGVVMASVSVSEQAEAWDRLQEARGQAMSGSRQMFTDDFEDGNIDGWMLASGDHTASVTSATAANGTMYSMEVTGGANYHYTGAYATFPSCTPSYLSVWLQPAAIGVSTTYFVVGDSSIGTNNGVVFLYAHDGGVWRIYSGSAYSSLNVYTANTWYHHEMILDWNTRLVDWYIDGVLQHSGIPFRSPSTTAVDRVHAYHYAYSSTGWFDEYYFSDSTAPTATPSATPTDTPIPTVTPTPTVVPTETPVITPTPAPVPATGPAGLGLLLGAVGMVLALSFYRRR
ncbi:hypothetical protein JXA80_00065 [bacterium]|nr:hypothetical protein [candidate division CSSED10-310 bacterium]